MKWVSADDFFSVASINTGYGVADDYVAYNADSGLFSSDRTENDIGPKFRSVSVAVSIVLDSGWVDMQVCTQGRDCDVRSRFLSEGVDQNMFCLGRFGFPLPVLGRSAKKNDALACCLQFGVGHSRWFPFVLTLSEHDCSVWLGPLVDWMKWSLSLFLGIGSHP